ncbi:phage tail protein [Enterobacter sp. Bisph1]|uniref:phage tail protein n=1 Tax=Enterobacter sp. Bisph1 TaxID=1274399 RepID=UPI00057C1AE4|nr:phage tail protein [Enterobacter sp. Bisph1]
MMMALGAFVFIGKTLPFQGVSHSTNYTWSSNERVGKRAAYQYLGPGAETLEITGKVSTGMTHGAVSLATLRLMAELGKQWPLIGGNGMIYGMFVINSVKENGSDFASDGTPRFISFTLSLTRVDESLLSIAEQARTKAFELYDSALNMLGVGNV